MEQVVFKIGEVSARLGLVDRNSNTLRAWAEEFREFLSAMANPDPGQPRRFTARDVQVLTAVREYRANHLSYDEIRARLRAGEHDVTMPGSADTPDRARDASATTESQALLPMTQLERLLAPLIASADEWRRLAEEYRGRLEAREARIEALEQRLEDLYPRLDTRSDAPADERGPGGDAAPLRDTPADRPGPHGHTALLGETPASGNGRVQAAAASLFPLPVRDSPWSDQERAAVIQTEASRRRWWRPWR